jgi:CheY-like chemotaxis protein
MHLDTNSVPTALLVDDDPSSQQANQERLEQDGYSVVLVRDAMDGLARARQMLPSAIFVHLRLTGVGNVSFMQALRADDSCRHIRVVVLPNQARVDAARKPLRPVPRDAW